MSDETSMTDRQAPASRFRQARRVAIAGLLLLLGLGVAFLGTAPSVDSQKRPTADDVAIARDIFRQIKASQDSDAPARVSLNTRQIGSLAIFASEASGVRRVEADISADVVAVRASLPLTGGLWINAAARVAGTHEGFPAVRLTIGRITLPAMVSRWSADVIRWLLQKRGVELPELDEAVRRFSVADGAVIADLALPRNTGLVGRAVSVAGANVDEVLVTQIYCRLTRGPVAKPPPQLAPLVRQAFSAADGPDSVAHNRAALVALAFYVVGEQAHNLAPAAAEKGSGCPAPAANAVLQGRADLAKHWTFSAALSAILGEERAVNIGEWKELHDSLPSGSGFSFVDLAANRSGLHIARRALDPASASATARWLKTASDADLLAPELTEAPEGLSDLEFVDRFGDLDEKRYRDALNRIDRHLAGSPH